jgi:hypothetical protein
LTADVASVVRDCNVSTSYVITVRHNPRTHRDTHHRTHAHTHTPSRTHTAQQTHPHTQTHRHKVTHSKSEQDCSSIGTWNCLLNHSLTHQGPSKHLVGTRIMRENVRPVRGWVLSVVMLLWLSVSVFAMLAAGRANHTATTKYKGTWKPSTFYNRSKSLYQDELNTLEMHIQTVHARYTKPMRNTETLQSTTAASSASSNATGSSGTAGKKKYLAANLFILGAQKAGTSSLFAALKRHMFFCSGHKEPHFFHYDHEYVKGRAFYEKYFIEHRTELRKCTTSTYSGISMKTHVPRNAPAGVSPVSTSPIEYTLKPRRYFIDGVFISTEILH